MKLEVHISYDDLPDHLNLIMMYKFRGKMRIFGRILRGLRQFEER